MAGGSMVVSVHDVAPPLIEEVRHVLEALDAVGARPRVLKVIPNMDGRHDIRQNARFMELLAAEVDAGSEIVLHGYTHHAAGPLRGPALARLRARLFAGDVAEYLTLTSTQMMERLIDGRDILRAVGVNPHGFCPPGWLASPKLPALLKRCGFRYYLTMATLLYLPTERRLLTPWMGYIGADPLQERLVGLGGRLCAVIAPSLPVVKVFLHPQGAILSPDFARSVTLIARLLRTRRLVTYDA